jgi:hypothetical protein
MNKQWIYLVENTVQALLFCKVNNEITYWVSSQKILNNHTYLQKATYSEKYCFQKLNNIFVLQNNSK